MNSSDRKKALVVEALLSDETVPGSLAQAFRALRAAAHRYDRAGSDGKNAALAALATAAIVFDEEVAETAGLPTSLSAAHRKIDAMAREHQVKLDQLSTQILELTAQLEARLPCGRA